MIGKLDSMLNKRNKARAIVMNLSKAFDTLNHNLLFKLKAYDFDTNTLTLMQVYFSNTHQLIKLGNKFSNLLENISIDFILGPLIFNTLLMISFFLLKLLHYTDCNTIFLKKKMLIL